MKGQAYARVKIPDPLPSISDDKARAVGLLQAEWKTIIETQMHFNDLIMRLRSIAITALTTLVGIALAVIKFAKLADGAAVVVFFVPWLLWLVVFVLDYFYYHRLLMGSVIASFKFDECRELQELGLFGMSSTITKTVTPPSSRWMIRIYYLLPAVIAAAVFVLWQMRVIKL